MKIELIDLKKRFQEEKIEIMKCIKKTFKCFKNPDFFKCNK